MALKQITFQVIGEPKPGGSKTAFYNKKLNRAMVVDASGRPGKQWRDSVKAAAMEAYNGPLLTGPLFLRVAFRLSRPKGHFGTGRNADKLKPTAPTYPCKKPDTTKLMRSLEDALTGVLWRDDVQVVHQYANKVWADIGWRPGAYVTVEELGGDDAGQ